ncbi:MAG: response regulator transcription factor [Comamonadaceae bacterium]|nr:response regulator transcription factor [Comamonadaceae bacterium]
MTPAPELLAAETRGRELLVVDDNPPTRYATSRVLRAAGYQVREAATGGDALAQADATIAAVVLDVHLPDIDGFEVCQRLRARADTARVPVVYLSAARVRDHDKLQGLHSGADVYMTHPAEPALLVATLHALIRARTAEDTLRSREARLRALFDSAMSGICVLDPQGRLVELNPAFAALLRRDAAELTGRAVRDFAPAEAGRASTPAWRATAARSGAASSRC